MMKVALGAGKATFSAAVDADKLVSVSGTVKNGKPFIQQIGTFDADLAIEVCGSVCPLACLPPLPAASVNAPAWLSDHACSGLSVCLPACLPKP
jgi:hypothetical protein